MPLRVHGHYSRAEIEAAFGVLWHKPSRCDLLFITLRKSEALFSPTTRYRNLALGPSLFHWESQSTTTASSATGQRYVHHAARGSRVLRFVREQRRVDGRPGGVTEPFRCLGVCHLREPRGGADLVCHRVAIRWRLERAIPAAWLHGCCVAHLLLLGIAAGLAV